MDYVQDSFPYSGQHHHQQMFYQPVTYGAFAGPQPHPRQADEFYHAYPHAEYADFVPYQDESEDMGEVSTRPRLTKEQAEVLEAHFQANHKPNSMVKRQLAMQTKLTLPRVANWFQNRRAKAKQQRKQEEYEVNQSQSLTTEADDDDEEESEAPTYLEPSKSRTQNDSLTRMMHVGGAEPCQLPAEPKTSKEASWASLQRAIRQAESAKNQQQAYQQTQMQRSPSSEMQQQPRPMQLPLSAPPNASFGPMPPQWQSRRPLMDPWSPTHTFQDTTFDFGFPHEDPHDLCKDTINEVFQPSLMQDHSPAGRDSWQESLPTPRGIIGDHTEAHFFGSPDLPLPIYPGSRRGSAAESLTANFGTFALASESPQTRSNPMPMMTETLRQPENHVDLAARRKRPRPEALTSASLRSRSYGALTSISPTFRPGMTPGTHTVRQVKSTGHNLNARFGGIRKASSAQRSPINVSTFAEAESFHRLMVQQAAVAAQSHGMPRSNAETATPVVTPSLSLNTQRHPDDNPGFMAQKLDLASRYQLPNTQHLTLMTASPPVTPFNAEFNHHGQHLSMPPVSAAPQYATFPDYTPPYSAGPLTNSSWSDAPLTSPDVPNFPHVSYIPSLHQPHQMDSPQAHFRQFVLASDNKLDMHNVIGTSEQKKTEFFIQEFPNQKEEHAHVAQQLAQHPPKNYVFANTAPCDYD